MAFIHGHVSVFKIGSTDLSAFVTNVDFNHEVDTHETTTYGKTYKTRLTGLKDGSFSVDGLYDSTAVSGVETVIPPLIGTTTTFEWGPEGSASGKKKYSGSCVIKSYQQTSPVGDVIKFSMAIETSDTITIGTYP